MNIPKEHMLLILVVGSLLLYSTGSAAQRHAEKVASYWPHLSWKQIESIAMIVDIPRDLPTSHITIIYDTQGEASITPLLMTLQYCDVKTSVYKLERDIYSTAYLDKLIQDIKDKTTSYLDAIYLFLTRADTSEDVIAAIREGKLGRRNIIYIFMWRKNILSGTFLSNLDEVTRVCVITHPRENSYLPTFQCILSAQYKALGKCLGAGFKPIGVVIRQSM